MQTPTAQIRVTLPIQLQGYLRAKASKFGLNLSSYVRHLIINDVKDMDYPVYEVTDKVKKDFEVAKQEE